MSLFRSARWLCAALFLSLGFSAGQAQQPPAPQSKFTLLPGTDLPGSDYGTLKGVTLDSCQASCEVDRLCRAFTFNEKAGWCFLKGEVAPEVAFAGATSGKVLLNPTPEALASQREGELPFPAADLIAGARGFAADLPKSDPPPPGISYSDLVLSGDEAAARANPAGAMVSYRQALAIVDNDPGLWLKLASSALSRADAEAEQGNTNSGYELGSVATYSALNAYLQSVGEAEQAEALSTLAHGLERREMWREAILTYRSSLALAGNATVQARLETVVAEHGFRVVSHAVDAEATTPRICAVFSDPLSVADVDLADYVVVEGAPGLAVEAEQTQICLEGVQHGRRYSLKLRAGLPSADGESLRNDVELDVYVPDRLPFVGFANNAYVMPTGLGGGLPITSVNATTADVVIYRIGDRAIAAAVRNGIFQGTLSGYSAEDVANQYGQKIWEGQLDLARGGPNSMTVTAVPVSEVLKDIDPGAYVITAKVSGQRQDYWRDMATQWFIVTDLGLTTVSGDDGVHAFVRSLTTAEPVPSAKVRLVAVNNEILGESTTDADGRADFAPGLARGEGGRAPQLLVVETDGGDYAFLDVAKVGFDLTDRGVDGRPSPGPLDLFATTERGVYRPGETVFITALLRDTYAKAITGLPLTLEIERPDGVMFSREVINDAGAAGYFAAVPMVAEAMRGSWRARFFADPNAEPLNTINFLVEDFEPERLAFEVTAPDVSVATDVITEVSATAKYLYGATAPGLAIEADAILRPVSSLPAYPGYVFGRADDAIEATRQPLGIVGFTDEAGIATAEVTLPEPQATTRPLEAQIILRLIDANGRAIERSLTRPVVASGDRIGIKPQFEEGAGLADGSEAAFDIIVVDPQGELTGRSGLTWSLSKVDTDYQWYRDNGVWKWESITTTRRVADGSVDASATGPVTIAASIDWGQYLIEVESTGTDATSTSYQFYAGYYYPQPGSDTPDTLQVALDKPAYKVGETAQVRLDPQFAGTALVMVVDNRIIDMVAVEVPAEGLSVPLPVTAEWGPGAYVTAILYRPSSLEEKRMPARALGLAFADVDPVELKLNVAIEAAEEALPREPLTVKVNLGQAAAGQTAYVAVAAVDLGILNLTDFETPDPDGWYFGQRQLGVEFRDLYGQLIDPTQGMPGALRFGGDGGSARLGTPPATSVLVALHSGVIEVGPDGTATITFDMPDFSGTVRLMAMAWTATAIGHAEKDVIVRDPVVVTLSPPRFLRLEDQSRLLVEINNVSGEAGSYRVALDTGPGIETDATQTLVDLPVGGRIALNLGLTGTAIGDNTIKLTVTAPNGDGSVKELVLGVRAPSGPRTFSTVMRAEPGKAIALDRSYFADLLPNSGSLTLAVGPLARLEVPELLLQLDRYPYGCAEQVASRAMPLLYLNDVAAMIGLGDDAALDERIKDAIADLLSKQTSTGSFGLWGPFSGSDLWLDSYVTEFLLRAKAKGHEIPEQAMTLALDNLANQVAYATDFTSGGEDVAYALYNLARAGRAASGDLRYYLEARLAAFATPLAKAQLGAALALYGDGTRAAMAFEAAVAGLDTPDNPKLYRPDYGSQLRDTAAVLALAAEFAPDTIDIGALTSRLSDQRDLAGYTSTQEDAWTLLAASALGEQTGNGSITLEGMPLTGEVYRRYFQEEIEATPVTILNTGTAATDLTISVTGTPASPPEAESAGFDIKRTYYLPDGTPTDLSAVKQNDRFVVVLEMTAKTLGSGQYVVADPLPAGFEIENPDLASSSGTTGLSWLAVGTPTHVEARTDQYVAAFRFSSDPPSFSTAYMVRAVSPGTFVHPGATVEDMYRPELRANTGSGRVEIVAVGQ